MDGNVNVMTIKSSSSLYESSEGIKLDFYNDFPTVT